MILFKHKETGRYLVDFTRKDKQPITTKVVEDARKWEETVSGRSSFRRYKKTHSDKLNEFKVVNL